jgi:hypothetical protein
VKYLLPILVSIALVGNLRAQIRLDTATFVQNTDPIYLSLEEYRLQILKQYDDTKQAQPAFSKWVDVPSAAVKDLFPSLRFAAITWDERAPPEAKNKKDIGWNYAFGLQVTIGVDRSSNQIKYKLDGYGNYEPFGKLLADSQVRIRDSEDARTVWVAFCDLHFKHWKSQPAIRKSEAVWHLGDVTIDRFHYYYEVNLDDRQRVKAARLHADEVKQQ